MRPSFRWQPSIEIAIVLAMPAAISMILMLANGFHPGDFSPFYSDEVHYWNEISNFASQGFASGYSVINELPANAEWSPFGAHGPAFAVIALPFAKLFGWTLRSPLFFNLACLTLAFAFWLATTKVNSKRRWTATAFLSSFFPLLLFVPTAMQESLQQAIGIVMAGFAAPSLTLPGAATARYVRPAFEALLFSVFTLARATWGLLYAVALALIPRPGVDRFSSWLAGAIVLSASVYANTQLYSPVPATGQVTMLLQALGGDLSAASNFCANIWRNISTYWLLTPSLELPAVLLRYQVVALLLGGAYIWLSGRRQGDAESERGGRFVCLILLASLVVVIFLYKVGSWRDYRLLAPAVIVAGLVLLRTADGLRLMQWFTLLQCLVLLACLPTYRTFRAANFAAPADTALATADILRRVIRYDVGADRWCNTLAMATPKQDNQVTAQLWFSNPGIGVSTITDIDKLALPPQSRWFIVDDQLRAWLAKRQFDWDGWELIAELPDSRRVYKNPAAHCPS